MLDIAIIGGGLAGLSLASQLQASEHSLCLFEAADRFGGRIFSPAPATLNHEEIADSEFHYDLGPGWIWPELQPRLAKFIAQHDLKVFAQWDNGHSLYHTERLNEAQRYQDQGTYAAARRIHGGTRRLVEVLLENLAPDLLQLNHQLREVIDHGDHIELCFQTGESEISITSRRVVLTLPPRLLATSVKFSPALDERMLGLLHSTPTWMAGYAKAVIAYPYPFWRDQGLSGSAISVYQGAALSEIFDASSAQAEHAVLSGFFALPPQLRSMYRDDLDALITEQLVRLFGKQAAQPNEILIKDWFTEPCTATQADEIPPPHHPQYGHAWLQLDHWNDKLFFAGTETAPQFGGYLEGALEASERVTRQLLM